MERYIHDFEKRKIIRRKVIKPKIVFLVLSQHLQEKQRDVHFNHKIIFKNLSALLYFGTQFYASWGR